MPLPLIEPTFYPYPFTYPCEQSGSEERKTELSFLIQPVSKSEPLSLTPSLQLRGRENQSRFKFLSERRCFSHDATFNSSRIFFKPQYC